MNNHWEGVVEKLQRQAALDARAARVVHTRDVAQNTELLALLTEARVQVSFHLAWSSVHVDLFMAELLI
jgi:hypothetical protein